MREEKKSPIEQIGEYHNELLANLIQLDRQYLKQELDLLKVEGKKDWNQIGTIHNLRKSNLSTVLNVSLFKTEPVLAEKK